MNSGYRRLNLRVQRIREGVLPWAWGTLDPDSQCYGSTIRAKQKLRHSWKYCSHLVLRQQGELCSGVSE